MRRISGDYWVDGVRHHFEGTISDEGTIDGLGVVPPAHRRAKDLGCDSQPEGGPHATRNAIICLVATAVLLGASPEPHQKPDAAPETEHNAADKPTQTPI